MKKRITLFMITSMLLLTALSASLAATVHGSANQWSVRITAKIGTSTVYSDLSRFGVNTSATAGFDTAFDAVESPPPQTGVFGYFYYPSNPTDPVDLTELSTSIIGPSDVWNWTYVAGTVKTSGTMTINWTASDMSTIPSGYDAYLQDSTGTTTLADMGAVTEYSFAASKDTTYTYLIAVVPTLVIPVIPMGALAAAASMMLVLVLYDRIRRRGMHP